MDFGLMFFSSAGETSSSSRYRLLLEAARFADTRGFSSVWTPERHFHRFGGLFPNPAVLGAALATITRRLRIRAGSLISPLHDVLRIAEEWSVVDNLSAGRVDVSFGSGWNVNDFVFFPERYESRHSVMVEQIEQVRELWRGGRQNRVNSRGETVELAVFPSPVQPELPVWVTSSGKVETFERAGAMGANLLTHLIGQDIGQLSDKIVRYRQALSEHGFDPTRHTVSLMLHTFVGSDLEEVRRTVREPFLTYLKSAVDLEQAAASGGGTISGGHRLEGDEASEDAMADLLEVTFERYFHHHSLLGTPDSVEPLVWRLKEAGVDEVACLVDFGIAEDTILDHLEPLARLAARFRKESLDTARTTACDDFLEDLEDDFGVFETEGFETEGALS